MLINFHLASYIKILLTISVLSGSMIVNAQTSVRVRADPDGPQARRVGQITQLASVYADNLPEDQHPVIADATIIGPCHIITNFHVAFGKSKDPISKKAILVKNRSKGHTVNFAFNLNENTGEFRTVLKARVIGFGNYIRDKYGIRGDLAVLELESCLDLNKYPALEPKVLDPSSEVPLGTLMTMSSQTDQNGNIKIVTQKGCKSASTTPVDGLFIANCESVGGMSGSAIYEIGSDQKWHWVGLLAGGNEGHSNFVSVAINSQIISTLLEKTFNEIPKKVPN